MDKENVKLRISENEQRVSENLCLFVNDIANNTIAKLGVFTIGLSGNRLSQSMLHLLVGVAYLLYSKTIYL